ncbi:hypothetical protein SAMN05660642_04940 [Geodermatophilus siccatus]|uniref:Uncharacterized protein n=1 Tax=Geodermatophilus siccatus TaxID=1137991 RepID=A0A1H0BU99_9ACTN|nr:hypothetical protein SAMN05660642_04940 [Geodermatophilus siccatus]
MTAGGDAPPAVFKATATYPYVHEEKATLALGGQLRELAAATGERPNWSTLAIAGPLRPSAPTDGPGLSG